MGLRHKWREEMIESDVDDNEGLTLVFWEWWPCGIRKGAKVDI